MAKQNGYFQVVNKGERLFIRLFPAVDGGEPVLINELREYLAFNNFVVDVVTLGKAIEGMTSQFDFPIQGGSGYAVNEYFVLKVSEDRMTAVARYYPPSDGGQLLSEAEIKNDLNYKGIKFGVDDTSISSFINNRQYCTNYIVAKGTDPIQGKDASIEYFFNTDPSVKPTLNPDGSVDFFHLNNISACTKGMLLARLTPEVLGKSGTDVLGTAVKPRDVKVLHLSYASNISLAEDALSIVSDVDGHVSLVDGKVFVSNVYEVVDVDTSTGNIEYSGDVLVTGNVKTGFCVEAEGNVEVRGVVEGALISSGGDVIIARGVNGMGKGTIVAKGNVVARFIENANVSAGGYVHSEAIMHSKVKASGDVTVNGKRGFIVGGSVKSLGSITAKTIGSEMGGDTEIEVGVDPKLKQRAEQLEVAINQAKTNVLKIEPILASFMKKIKEKAPLTPEQLNYFKQLSEQYKVEKQKYEEYDEDYKVLCKELETIPSVDSSVNATDIIYPGTKITINEVSQTISKPIKYSKLVRDGADIRVRAL